MDYASVRGSGSLASDEWKEFGLSPWPFNPGRFKFRANNGSINVGVGLQGGAKMSDDLV